ncbi:ABC transporter [Bacillus anthracis]|nr:ABC transporter [Bacillus sp. B3-WWTP-C-10-D-3]MDR4319959.1 ABC transporter [Bacillus paranthracis]MDR4406248.1 ABC transporter [Bacillus anthracis]RXG09476.1 ABC transporter [Bacillus cereus]RXJ21434.1 ABC transporter [Bacillus albus]
MNDQYLNIIGFGGLFINAILLVKVATHEKRKFILN